MKILDPTFTTAYITRNFGYMVYDMPFGLDEKGQPKPQMVDKYTTSKDGKLWTFTLRPDLKFSDGSAGDLGRRRSPRCSAGPRKDSIGRAMTAISGAEWKAVDATHLHPDAEGAVRHGARRHGQAVGLSAGGDARADGQAADDRRRSPK